MIGVIANQSQRAAVEEFFQLFKTPWEFYTPGESYEVLVAADELPPEAEAPLVILYGTEPRGWDKRAKLEMGERQQKAVVKLGNETIPLYCGSTTFKTNLAQVICTDAAGATVGLQVSSGEGALARLGYDLFEEVRFLLTTGQPVEHALSPTLDLHIALLRQVVVEAGAELIEVLPVPAGYDFSVCLTHDIDFVGIQRHKLDHTMWGFLLRATIGSLRDFVRGKVPLSRVAACWKAAISLPFVFLGWAKDFWMLFDWYLEVEKGLSPTYFFIPFKHRQGDKLRVPHASRRASGYGIAEIPELIQQLKAAGCEIGVHGIDSWHDVSKGVQEQERVNSVSGPGKLGIRMHWLLRDETTLRVLEQAGYSYDSTCGYNETPGYFCGTAQVFRPFGCRNLLELPLHIQDGALFYAKRLGLSENQAWEISKKFIARAQESGGVLTLLWHDRSPGPERFWGEFYAELVAHLRSLRVWFAHGSAVTVWFRNRRTIEFGRADTAGQGAGVLLKALGHKISPAFKVKVHGHGSTAEHVWDGAEDLELSTSDTRTAKAGPETLVLTA